MKVGIVTFEFPGFSKNGGIGTAYGRLVKELASQKIHTTVFYLDINGAQSKAPSKLVRFESEYIHIQVIQIPQNLFKNHSWALSSSLAALDELQNHNLDIIHFHDCLGFSWAASQLKKLGLGFTKSKIVLGMHGPNYWVRNANKKLITDFVEIQQSLLEKDSFENADEIVSPSKYLLEFLQNHGWTSNAPKYVIPNCNSFDSQSTKTKSFKKNDEKITELIFFGRLEPRKGILIFVKALELLTETLKQTSKKNQPKLKITFLGKDYHLNDGTSAKKYIENALNNLSEYYSLKFYTDLDPNQCKEYFAEAPNSLIVLPSLADNSPYAVVECLEQGLRFICSDVGGQGELLDTSSIKKTMFSPTPNALCQKILENLNDPAPPPVANKALFSANTQWLQRHQEEQTIAEEVKSASASISVVIKSNLDLKRLKKTLDSIAQQTKKPVEVLVYVFANDLIDKHVAIDLLLKQLMAMYKSIGLRVLTLYRGWLDDIYIHARSNTKGSHLLLLVEGDILNSDAMPALLKVASNPKIDVFLFGMNLNSSINYPPPVSIEYSLFFDSVCKFPTLIKKDIFVLRTKNSPDYLSYHFSFKIEFLIGLQIEGKVIESVPFSILTNPARQEYYPYAVTETDEFHQRLLSLSQFVDLEDQKKLKYVFNHIKSKKNQNAASL